MTAFLNEDGTFPIASDALNMAVMYGARMSAHCFSSQVGSGSRQDCLLEDSLISFWTSSIVSERNEGKSAHESSGGAARHADVVNNDRQEIDQIYTAALTLKICLSSGI